MPGTDGLEATRQIRALEDPGKSKIPIIAMSAHVFQEEVDQYLAAGMDGFLGKPIDPTRLRAALDAAVRNHTGMVSLPSPAKSSKTTLLDRAVLEQDLAALGVEPVKDLVTIFLESGNQTLKQLVDAAERGDLDQVFVHSHSLKGAATSVGLVALSDHLHKLETAAKRGQSAECSELVARLEPLYQSSCEALESGLSDLMRLEKKVV